VEIDGGNQISYSVRGGWCSNEVVGSFRVEVWKNIRRGWEVLSRFIKYEVGEGSKTNFWHNLWYGYPPLKASFPEYF
jgi:hypothetical protein